MVLDWAVDVTFAVTVITPDTIELEVGDVIATVGKSIFG
jgi:hypothetical protein